MQKSSPSCDSSILECENSSTTNDDLSPSSEVTECLVNEYITLRRSLRHLLCGKAVEVQPKEQKSALTTNNGKKKKKPCKCVTIRLKESSPEESSPAGSSPAESSPVESSSGKTNQTGEEDFSSDLSTDVGSESISGPSTCPKGPLEDIRLYLKRKHEKILRLFEKLEDSNAETGDETSSVQQPPASKRDSTAFTDPIYTENSYTQSAVNIIKIKKQKPKEESEFEFVSNESDFEVVQKAPQRVRVKIKKHRSRERLDDRGVQSWKDKGDRGAQSRKDKDDRGVQPRKDEDDRGVQSWKYNGDRGVQSRKDKDDRGVQPRKDKDDRGAQSWKDQDDRGVQSWKDKDDMGVQSRKDKDNRGAQSWKDKDDRGVQFWKDKDDRGVQYWKDKDDRAVQSRKDKDDRGVQSRKDNDDRGVQSWKDKDDRGVKPWKDKDERGIQPVKDKGLGLLENRHTQSEEPKNRINRAAQNENIALKTQQSQYEEIHCDCCKCSRNGHEVMKDQRSQTEVRRDLKRCSKCWRPHKGKVRSKIKIKSKRSKHSNTIPCPKRSVDLQTSDHKKYCSKSLQYSITDSQTKKLKKLKRKQRGGVQTENIRRDRSTASIPRPLKLDRSTEGLSRPLKLDRSTEGLQSPLKKDRSTEDVQKLLKFDKTTEDVYKVPVDTGREITEDPQGSLLGILSSNYSLNFEGDVKKAVDTLFRWEDSRTLRVNSKTKKNYRTDKKFQVKPNQTTRSLQLSSNSDVYNVTTEVKTTNSSDSLEVVSQRKAKVLFKGDLQSSSPVKGKSTGYNNNKPLNTEVEPRECTCKHKEEPDKSLCTNKPAKYTYKYINNSRREPRNCSCHRPITTTTTYRPNKILKTLRNPKKIFLSNNASETMSATEISKCKEELKDLKEFMTYKKCFEEWVREEKAKKKHKKHSPPLSVKVEGADVVEADEDTENSNPSNSSSNSVNQYVPCLKLIMKDNKSNTKNNKKHKEPTQTGKGSGVNVRVENLIKANGCENCHHQENHEKMEPCKCRQNPNFDYYSPFEIAVHNFIQRGICAIKRIYRLYHLSRTNCDCHQQT